MSREGPSLPEIAAILKAELNLPPETSTATVVPALSTSKLVIARAATQIASSIAYTFSVNAPLVAADSIALVLPMCGVELTGLSQWKVSFFLQTST